MKRRLDVAVLAGASVASPGALVKVAVERKSREDDGRAVIVLQLATANALDALAALWASGSGEGTPQIPARRRREWPRYAAAIAVLRRSGLRIGELLALQWRHIDFDALAILIQLTITVEDGEDELSGRSGSKIGPPKTAAGRREVANGPSGMAALRTWRDQQQATSPSSRLNRVIELKRELGSNTAVARELGVSEAAVRKQLRRSLTGDEANAIEQLYVFGSHNGASWLLPSNFRSHAWRPRLTAAGLIDDDGEPIATPHDFRHHYASAAIGGRRDT